MSTNTNTTTITVTLDAKTAARLAWIVDYLGSEPNEVICSAINTDAEGYAGCALEDLFGSSAAAFAGRIMEAIDPDDSRLEAVTPKRNA